MSFRNLDSNQGLRVQSAASMPPGPFRSRGGRNQTFVSRLSCERSAIELRLRTRCGSSRRERTSLARPSPFAGGSEPVRRFRMIELACPVCRTGAQPIGQPRVCAPAPDRTETSGSSDRRADPLRHRGSRAVVVSTAPSRRLCIFHRAVASRAPGAFGDEGSNLNGLLQRQAACQLAIPDQRITIVGCCSLRRRFACPLPPVAVLHW
jgi:hypothetical protein